MKSSIRHRLILILICFAVVPLLLLGAVLSWEYYDSERKQVIAYQEMIVSKASSGLEFFVHEQEQKILSFIRSSFLPDMSAEQQKSLLAKFLAVSRDEVHGYVFSEIALLDGKGLEMARVSRDNLVKSGYLADRSGEDVFAVPAGQEEFYYGPDYFSKETGEPLMKMCVAIRDLRSGNFWGVFVAELKLEFFWNHIAGMKIGKTGVAYLTDELGRVLVHPNPSIVLKRTHFKVPAQGAIMPGLDGEKAVVAAKKIHFGARPMFFVGEIPASEAILPINRSLLYIVVFVLLTMSGAVMLGILIVRQLVTPIESLAATARDIRKGNFAKKAVLERDDELGDLAGAFNDMTSQLVESIYALEKEKGFVQHVIESLGHPFYVIDVRDYSIKLANSAAHLGDFPPKSTCYRLTHQSDTPCRGEDHPCPVVEILKTKKPVVVEHVHLSDKGVPRTFEVYGYPIFNDKGEVVQIIEYNIDITDRKVMQDQLIRSQKLEAVGVLAGGVAHDFNNYLSSILGYGELILMSLAEDDPLRKKIEAMYNAGVRSADLTRQLLAFSRKQVLETKVINLNAAVENTMKMIGRLIGENIQVTFLLDSTIGNIKADPAQVEQIIMNLAVNSRDAMPFGGTLFFETGRVLLDEDYCRVHSEARPGPSVVLTVTDTGQGMDHETREMIFDPFFTTKEKSKGTGLGLSTVYGIVKQHGGHIFLYSEPGCGTTFKIYFPEAVGEVVEDLETVAPEVMRGGTETILVVDDEPSIRALIIDTLRPLGYSILQAGSGEDALEVFREEGKMVDLLLTDVILTGMNGKALAAKMSALQPDLPVLYMSGYTDNLIVHQGVLASDTHFIGKPVVPSLLTKKIRRMLDNS